MNIALAPRCAALCASANQHTQAQRLRPSAANNAVVGSSRAVFLSGTQLSNGVSNGIRVSALFNKFRQGADDAGVYGSQGRDEYSEVDVEDYFNYMGMLAEEGTYDRMEQMLSTGMHPADILLLMACSENDTPKVEELLRSGADPNIQDNKGRSPMELATKDEVKQLLQQKMASV